MGGIDRRRYPRLFLAQLDSDYKEILGAKILWPREGQSVVYDMSYAGLAVECGGRTLQFKSGQHLEVGLKLPGQDPFPIEVDVIRVTPKIVALKVATTSPDGRIKIDQFLKDQIVGGNTRRMNPAILDKGAMSDVWYHGPFDTNFFLWGQSDKLTKVVFEYDNLLLTYEGNSFKVTRSASTADETLGYMGDLN
ncbi:MAG: hypothetical protein AB7H97_13215, partial [Pseudobdellovibrionaceae bacterium]